ncbi:response regulator transcription factor [Flavobacterium sp.]|uniref:response regulator transcription factor n=1 Tax=Flavobacterium sp. TaxID=239 RepID=UPI00286A7271|nr:response regulator transcription factor [Flavobacterium sp.]
MKNILMVEDDVSIIELVDIHLKDIHCQTTKANNGTDGLRYASKNKYDLIILDIMLPDIDGIEICKRIRAEKNFTPILMLTARSEEIDKIIGLETGADDYLTKPFSIREFIARVKAIIRRSEIDNKEKSISEEVFTCDSLSIDPQKRKVTLSNAKVELTPKEFDLLYLFMSNPGKSYSRENLLNLVWGYEFSGYEHTVNSHINRLRTKIETDLASPKYILTTWGIGYRFTDEIK